MPELILVALAILAGCSAIAWAIIQAALRRSDSATPDEGPVIKKFPSPDLRIQKEEHD